MHIFRDLSASKESVMCGEKYFAHKLLYTLNSINKVAKGSKKHM